MDTAILPDGTDILTREAVDAMVSIYSARQIDLARRAITAIVEGRIADATRVVAKLADKLTAPSVIYVMPDGSFVDVRTIRSVVTNGLGFFEVDFFNGQSDSFCVRDRERVLAELAEACRHHRPTLDPSWLRKVEL